MQMFHILFALVIFSSLCFLLFIGVLLGRLLGRWKMEHHPLKKVEVITVVEGAVFTLLGLLVAFTFTGAYDRFEKRKIHIIEEANAVETAYMRIGLLSPKTQTPIKQSMKEYLDMRITAYKLIPHLDAAFALVNQSNLLKEKIWEEALQACKITNDSSATQLLIPALNAMFDAENTGFALTGVHPPVIIFLLLIGLSVLSAFLAGFTSVEGKTNHFLYMQIYIIIMAFVIYLIIDLELPRVGLVRVTSFDQYLVDVRNRMN